MNREIKFRAKNVNNGKWYYSYIDINPKQERSENELESRLFWQQIENGTLDIKTLGQFANLFDKNEIEICDGDIVELDTHLYLWVIKWMDGGLFYEIIDPQNCQKNERYPISTITEWSRNTGAGYDVWERDSKREIEIIGNIYENPELLKIKCTCNDSNCENTGQEGEVAGHIENCPCYECHHSMGKLN